MIKDGDRSSGVKHNESGGVGSGHNSERESRERQPGGNLLIEIKTTRKADHEKTSRGRYSPLSLRLSDEKRSLKKLLRLSLKSYKGGSGTRSFWA